MSSAARQDRLKILYHHRVASKDGQAVHIEGLIAALEGAGHSVHVVSPPAFGTVSFGGQSRTFALLKRLLPRALYELLEVGYNVPAFFRLRAAYRHIQPDLVYERCNLFMLAGILIARLHRKPIFLEVNAPLARERAAHDGLALTRIASWLERLTWKTANLVLPVSRVLGDTIEASGVPSKRIVVIPNGIDEQSLAPSDNAEAKVALGLIGKTVLGFVGFVREWHGLEDVIDLLADPDCTPDLHFVIVGDGPAISALKARAQRLGVSEKTTFAGLIDRDGVAQHLAAFDVALQPRAVDYASPLKLFEYMACGKAIAAPDQPNIREILTDGKNARLFNPMVNVAFRQAVLELARDKLLRDRLAGSARQTIFDRGYTWGENARRIIALYNDHSQGRQGQLSLRPTAAR